MILPEDPPPAAAPAAGPPMATTPAWAARPWALEAYLQAAGWALMGYAGAPKDVHLSHRAACAAGLADALWDHAAAPPDVEDQLVLRAYRAGYRAGCIVRHGNATPPQNPTPRS